MANLRLVLALQALMLVTFLVFEAAVVIFFVPLAPRANLAGASALVALYPLYGGWRWLMLATGRKNPSAIIGRSLLLDDQTIWTATAGILGLLWLLFPYAEPRAMYAYVVACVTATSGFAFSSIRLPPASGSGWLAPLALPLCLSLYLVLHPDPLSDLVAFAITANAIGLLAGRYFVQTIMLGAYHAQQQTDRALAEVSASREARTRFLAAASHDLGQPLQAARLFFDQAIGSGAEAMRRQAGLKAQRALDAMDSLMRHMLDHLRLEADQVRPRIQSVPLGPLVAQLAEFHEDAARHAGADIIVMESARVARGDPDLIERCVGNFIANAVRHARARRILVGIRSHADSLRVWVIDDGAGVSPDARARMFEDFAPGPQHGGGFGLGLASARRIAALMNGAVGYRPSPGGGSGFWLELPRA